MAKLTLMKSGGMAALAAGLAMLALPAAAQAQDGGHGRWNRGGDAGSQNGTGGENRGGENWRGNGGGTAWRGREQSGAAPTPQPQAPVQVQAQPQQQRNWSRGDGDGGGRWNRGNGNGSGNGNEGGAAWRGRGNYPVQAQVVPTPQPQTERRNWSGDGQWRNREGADRDDARRRGDVARWRNDNDNAWHGSNDYRWRGDRQNYARNWNRDWRRDDRYDWRGYRNYNRDVFRLGTYYAPYRGYSYRRLSAGFYLDVLFFGSRYWIDDPWQYRLPPAYGPYRWVRYYDDALLVDTYTGEVVDVIYSFFW